MSDPRINFSNKAAKMENRTKVEDEGGIHNFVEKCLSDATINEMLERENVKSLTAAVLSSKDDDSSGEDSDFPDLDEALEESLDINKPKFIAESPLPGRKFISIENVDKNLNVSFGNAMDMDSVLVENGGNNQMTITAIQKSLDKTKRITRNTEVQHLNTTANVDLLIKETGIAMKNERSVHEGQKS